MSLHDIFKPNDVRGVYPGEINEELAYKTGYGLVRTRNARTIAVGRDSRISSPALYEHLMAGAADAGARCIPLGLCPTELVYFVSGKGLCDLGAMVTASHNPPQYNGFKIVRKGGEIIPAGTGLADLREFVERSDIRPRPLQGQIAPPGDFLHDYIEYVLSLEKWRNIEGRSIVVDAGNGAAGPLWERVARSIPVKLTKLNFEPDGRFPARGPDPYAPGALDALVRAVNDTGADLGLAFDGDADRVAAVTARGSILTGSDILAILGARILEPSRGDRTIACNLVTSRRTIDYLRSLGWDTFFVPVGHGTIKQILRADERLVFVGESSGHFYFRSFFCADSAFLTSLMLTDVADRLDELVARLPGGWLAPDREPRIPIHSYEHGLRTCRQAAVRFIESEGIARREHSISCEVAGRIVRNVGMEEIQTAVAVRCDTPGGWFCLRPSGTEPVIRIAAECRSAEQLSRWLDRLQALIHERSRSVEQK